jgi:hypothetical protein
VIREFIILDKKRFLLEGRYPLSTWFLLSQVICGGCAMPYSNKSDSNVDASLLPITSHCLNFSIISSQRDVESNHSIAGFNKVKILLWDASFGGSPIEEKLNLLQKSGFIMFIKLWAEILWINCLCLCEHSHCYILG